MAITIDRRDGMALHVCTTVNITTLDAATYNFCSAGGLFYEGGEQTHNPRLLGVPEVVSDDGGVVRAIITIANRGAHWATVGGGRTMFSTFQDALRVYPISQASVQVKRRNWTTSSDDTTDQLMVGTVVRPANIGPVSCSFEVELRDNFASTTCPARRIDSTEMSTDAEKDAIPKEIDGEPLPVAFGHGLSHKHKGLYSNLSDGEVITVLNDSGLVKPRTFALRPVAKEDTRTRHAFLESNGLSTNISTAGWIEAFMYFGEVDAWARVWDGTDGISFATSLWKGLAWTAQDSRQPYLTIPLKCTRVDDNISAGLTDGQYAIDGREDTYATLGVNTGGNEYQGCWDVQNFPQLGRIIRNTSQNPSGTDLRNHEAQKPAGIRAFAIVVNPAGAPFASSSVVLDVVYPIGGHSLFNVTTTYSLTGPSAGDAAMITHGLQTQAVGGGVGGADDGWLGTKMERGDFTTHSENDTNSDDYPLYSGSNGSIVAPFRVRVRTYSSSIYVAQVGLLVGFQLNGEGNIVSRTKTVAFTRSGGVNTKVSYPIDSVPEGSGRNGWGRGGDRGERSRLDVLRSIVSPPELAEVTNPIGICWPGPIDDGSGTYTGTASGTFTNLADSVKALIELPIYGDATAVTSGLGSFTKARTDLDQVVAAVDISEEWESVLNFTTHGNLDSRLKEIEQEFGGLVKVAKRSNGQWGMHVWRPALGNPSTVWSNSLWESDAIEPGHTVLGGPEGILFDLSDDDPRNVYNHFIVRYQYDVGSGSFGRTLVVGRDDSDDGYRDSVGGTPVADISDLCEWSQNKFGGPRILEIKLTGVDSPYVASAVCAYAAMRFYRPRPRIRFTGTQFWNTIEVGHVFRFSNTMADSYGNKLSPFGAQSNEDDGGDWDENYWRVEHVGFPENGGLRTVQIVAEHYPQTIGGELVGGGGFMDDVPPPEEVTVIS